MKIRFGKEKRPDAEASIAWAKEKCVICGKETAYDFQTPISQRAFYMEGAGQLCRKCFCELYEREC